MGLRLTVQEIALGLDIASTTGFALVGRGIKAITGVWEIPTKDYGTAYAFLFQKLDDMKMVHQFSAIGFEAPWLNPGKDDMHKLRILHGLPVVVELWAALQEPRMTCYQVDARTAKRALTRNPFAEKHEMQAAARRMGVHTLKHDEADAFAVGMVVVSSHWRKAAVP